MTMSNLAPKYTPTTYAEARAILERHNTSRLALCYATALQHDSGGYAIYHHGTAIVTYRADGTIRLYGAGWTSRTTADRMTRFTPRNVNVSTRGGTLTVSVDGTRVGDASYGITLELESEA